MSRCQPPGARHHRTSRVREPLTGEHAEGSVEPATARVRFRDLHTRSSRNTHGPNLPPSGSAPTTTYSFIILALGQARRSRAHLPQKRSVTGREIPCNPV